MRKLLMSGAAASCFTVLAAAMFWPALAQQQQALVIQGGTLIDGNGGAPVPNSVIVIEGDRIAAVGRQGQVQIPAGAQVINAAGKWVTPGLIDAKSNWNWPYGEAYLRWGVTSAMVTGTRNDTGIADRDAVAHGVYPAPRLYQGVINLRGGGPDGKRPDTYVPGAGQRVAHSPDEARALARSNLEGGADFLGTNDGDGPPELFAAYADEAHKAGKAVVMRCVGPATRGRECVLAGADIMVHTGEIGDQIAKDPDKWKTYIALPPDAYCDIDPAREKEFIQFLLQHPNTALEPDMMATDRGFPSMWKRVQQEDQEFFSDPVLRTYYPAYQMQHTLDNVKDPSTYLTPAQIEHRACGYKNHAQFLHDFTAAGGHIVAASDIFQSPPGLGVHQEMAVFQDDVKMPPMKVLQAATKWVADHFRIKDIGTVEAGKLADLDIVTADPLTDIKNMRKIDTVIKDGKVVDRNYHPWYKGWLFANDPQRREADDVVEGAAWAAALKRATFRPGGGGNEDITGAAAQLAIPDPFAAPTPGIESIFPHTVIQGSSGQTVDIKGFNFVKRSVVYVDGTAVPTEVVSRTEIKATLDPNVFADAGNRVVVVKNPEPLNAPEWGEKSNMAHVLVPFSYTTAWSHNRY